MENPLQAYRDIVEQLSLQTRVALANSDLGLAIIAAHEAGTISSAEALEAAFGVIRHARNNQIVARDALNGRPPELSPDDVLRLVS